MVYFPPQQNNKNGINLRFLSRGVKMGENPSTPSWSTLQEEEEKRKKKKKLESSTNQLY